MPGAVIILGFLRQMDGIFMQRQMFGTGELIFDLACLALASGFSLFYLLFSTAEYALLFGVMTFVLVLGDAFHRSRGFFRYSIRTRIGTARSLNRESG